MGGWDDGLVHTELFALQNAGFDVTLTGFEPAGVYLSAEDDEPEDEPVTEDDFDALPPETPRTVPGQIWRLGHHTLMCGDAGNEKSVQALLDGHFVRLTVTSPPYGVGKDYEEKGIAPCLETMTRVINAIKDKTLIIGWNVGDLYATGTQFTEPTGALSVSLMQQAGFKMLYTRIWKKPGGNFAGNNPYFTVTTKPVQNYEYLYAFAAENAYSRTAALREYLFDQAKKAEISNSLVESLGGPKFMCGHWFTDHQWSFIDEKNYLMLQKYCLDNSIDAFRRSYNDLKHEYQENTIFSHCLSADDFSSWGMWAVWEFNTVSKRLGGHAAAFPVELPARYIKMHSYPGSVVYDPFGGTGTTLIACEQLDRTCFMMEREPKYCDVIIDRWEQFTGEKAVLVNG